MKKHLTKSNIPKEERKTYIVLKNITDILRIPPEEIPKVHKYCLDLTAGVVQYMTEEQLLAFTMEQIVYIPVSTLSYFPESVLRKKKTEAEAFEGTVEYKYSDRKTGRKEYYSEEIRPFDAVITALAQNGYRRQFSERAFVVRRRSLEAEWEATGRIHSRDVGYMLGISMRAVERFMEAARLEDSRHELDYRIVLRIVRELFVVNQDASSPVWEEMRFLGYERRVLERLPVLYSKQEAMNLLGVDLDDSSEDVSERWEVICEEQAYVDLPIKSKSSARFFKSVIEESYNDPVFEAERERIQTLCGMR